tara:strand:- start:13830 stop:14276 length:447 start_codon:yes stop_codon:yes gene_type:complete
MVGKKGYLKTVEALIAVIMLFGFFIYMLPGDRIEVASVPQDIELMQDVIFDEISNNVEWRQCIVQDNPKCIDGEITSFVGSVVNPERDGSTLLVRDFKIGVCTEALSCNVDVDAGDKEVYAADIIIRDLGSSNVLKTAIFKLFIWEKS